MPPTLKRVVRLDSIPIRKAVFTDEGYLKDRPILTSTGIFEYTNPDGSIRRELRLPEDVFAPESLASYKGKPIIITHDAGLVNKDNVRDNQVGTILSEGIPSGNDVKADIIIHATDEMKDKGYKELSLGYNLDLEETPGEWKGQPYDAIQRNIIINHLALVREARAGEQARLNIDSRDSDTLKGGKSMKNTPKKTVRGDGILSKEELEQAIKEYKARRAKEADAEKPVASEQKPKATPEKKPAVEPEKVEKKAEVKEEVKPTEKEKPTFDEDVEAVETVEKKPETVEEKIEKVKENRNMRDEEGDPKDKLSAMGMIAHQDEDIDTLFDIIDTLLAEREFKMKEDCAKADSDDDAIPDRDKAGESVANCDGEEEEEEEDFEFEEDEDDEAEGDPEDDEDWDFEEDEDDEVEEEEEEEETFEEDEDDEDVSFEEEEDWEEDEDDEEEWEEEEDEEFQTDSHDSPIPDSTGEVHHVKKLNSDSVDAVINERIALGMMGRKLNMDGLEKLSIMAAKKRIVKAVRPNIRLDGKSNAYINAAYDCAVDEIKKRSHKGVKYQKKQMFNKDSRSVEDTKSSVDARREMIERQINRNK